MFHSPRPDRYLGNGISTVPPFYGCATILQSILLFANTLWRRYHTLKDTADIFAMATRYCALRDQFNLLIALLKLAAYSADHVL
jgi:hypothetical protein